MNCEGTEAFSSINQLLLGVFFRVTRKITNGIILTKISQTEERDNPCFASFVNLRCSTDTYIPI